MNKKKIMAALLATVCLTSGVAAITACGGNGGEKPPVVTEDAPEVTFNFNMEGYDDEIVKCTSSGNKYYVSAPAAPEITGYRLAGWYYDDQTFTQPFDSSSDEVTRDVTVYAKWEQAYTVTFDYNNAALNNVTVNSDYDGGEQFASRPATDPETDGFVFVGWYKDNNYAQAFDFSAALSGNVTVYAKWQAVAEGRSVIKVTDQSGKPLSGVYVMIKYYDAVQGITQTVSNSNGIAISVASDDNGFVIFPEFAKKSGVSYLAYISDYGATSSNRAYPYGYTIGETGCEFDENLLSTVILQESASFYDNQRVELNYDRAWVLIPDGAGLNDGYALAGKNVALNDDGTLDNASTSGVVNTDNESETYVELMYRIEAGRYYYYSFCPYVTPADINDNDADNTVRLENAMKASTGIYEISFCFEDGTVRAAQFEGSGLVQTDENGIPVNTIAITGTAPAGTSPSEREKYTGTNAIIIDYNSDEARSTKYFYLTADEDGFITIKIRRTGDARIREYVNQTVDIDENATACTYVKADNEELKDVPVDGSVQIVMGFDGYYHVGDEDGPIVYAQLKNAMARVGSLGIFLLHEDTNGLKEGSYIRTYSQDTDTRLITYSYDYYNAVTAYLDLVNADGVYPVNDQIKQILSFLSQRANGITEAKTGYEWLLACQYYETIREPFAGAISAGTATSLYASRTKEATLTVNNLTAGYYLITASGNTSIDGAASGEASITLKINGGAPLTLGGMIGAEGNQEKAAYVGAVYLTAGDVITVLTNTAADLDFKLTLTAANSYTLTGDSAVNVTANNSAYTVLAIGDGVEAGTYKLTASNNSFIDANMLDITFTYSGGKQFKMSGFFGYYANIAVTPGATILIQTNVAGDISFDLALSEASGDAEGSSISLGDNTITLAEGYSPYSYSFTGENGYYKITLPSSVHVYLGEDSVSNIAVTDNGDGTHSGIFEVNGSSVTLVFYAYLSSSELAPFSVTIEESSPQTLTLGAGESNALGIEIAYRVTEIDFADGVTGAYKLKISPANSMMTSLGTVKIVAYINGVECELVNEQLENDVTSSWLVCPIEISAGDVLTVGLVNRSDNGATEATGYVTITLLDAE